MIGTGRGEGRSGGVALRPRPLPPVRENAKRCMYRAAIARKEEEGDKETHAAVKGG